MCGPQQQPWMILAVYQILAVFQKSPCWLDVGNLSICFTKTADSALTDIGGAVLCGTEGQWRTMPPRPPPPRTARLQVHTSPHFPSNTQLTHTHNSRPAPLSPPHRSPAWDSSPRAASSLSAPLLRNAGSPAGTSDEVRNVYRNMPSSASKLVVKRIGAWLVQRMVLCLTTDQLR